MLANNKTPSAITYKSVICLIAYRLTMVSGLEKDMGKIEALLSMLLGDDNDFLLGECPIKPCGVCSDGTSVEFSSSISNANVPGIRFITEILAGKPNLSINLENCHKCAEEMLKLFGSYKNGVLDEIFNLLFPPEESIQSIDNFLMMTGAELHQRKDTILKFYMNPNLHGHDSSFIKMDQLLDLLDLSDYSKMTYDIIGELRSSLIRSIGLNFHAENDIIPKIYLWTDHLSRESVSRTLNEWCGQEQLKIFDILSMTILKDCMFYPPGSVQVNLVLPKSHSPRIKLDIALGRFFLTDDLALMTIRRLLDSLCWDGGLFYRDFDIVTLGRNLRFQANSLNILSMDFSEDGFNKINVYYKPGVMDPEFQKIYFANYMNYKRPLTER